MLECVVNISEGRRAEIVGEISSAGGGALLDVHVDADHNRSVLTLAGSESELESAVRAVTTTAVRRLDLRTHTGAHPRFGVVDVVPFVDLDHPRAATDRSVDARDRFARWAGETLALPCLCFGPGYPTLPEIRRAARDSNVADTGPATPHLTAGVTAVGARGVLVAYNLWLASVDVGLARAIAAQLRGPAVRALGLDVGGRAQVSCNLIDPFAVGPAVVYDAVAALSAIARAETVGLVPTQILQSVPEHRLSQLDLDYDRTIESRIR